MEALKNAPKITKMKEIDRLAYIVRAIENDCSAIPIGALKMLPTHELRYNNNFESLNIDKALSL